MLDQTTPKGRILAAALEQAAAKSWADVTLLDIAEAADCRSPICADCSRARPISSPPCCAPSTTRSSSARPSAPRARRRAIACSTSS